MCSINDVDDTRVPGEQFGRPTPGAIKVEGFDSSSNVHTDR